MENKNITNNNTIDKHGQKERLIIFGLFVLLFVVVLISLRLGRYGMTFSDILNAFTSLGNPEAMASQNSAVLFVIRLPRICLAILVGAALAAAGAAYQGLFKNPMVSPDILGVSSGASVGACLGILLSFSDLSIQVLAFIFGLGAVFLVLAISTAVGRGSNNLLIMILAGTVISALFSAITSLMKYLADTDTKLPEITFWLMGSFAKTGSWKNVLIVLIAFLVGVIPIMLLRWKINVMSFGEEEAQAMGVNTKRVRLTIIIAATLLTASSVALCDIVGWVGLIMPHISRFIVGPNYKYLLPTAILTGATFMLIVDNVARSIGPGEIPLGILTAIIGAPFIYLSIMERKERLVMILDIKNMTCGYDSKKVMEDFSTTIKTGEILCLLGPNGVGKTTLFKTILGFLQPMAGTVSLDDKNLASYTKSQLAKVMGYVPQAHNPPFPFSVIDVVVMGRTAHLGPFCSPSTKDIALAYNALEKLEITNLKDRVYTELSGGERQMVLIARALVQEPAFIILDEPTSNLDFGNQVRVLKQVIALSKRNIGIVMTTHFPDHAFLCQGRVVLMEKNNLFTSGTAHNVLTEKSLSSAYGVGVKITNAKVNGTIIRSCSPII